jgi:hypothetical protein
VASCKLRAEHTEPAAFLLVGKVEATGELPAEQTDYDDARSRGLDEGQHSIRINEIVLGKRSVTADTAVRLAKALGTSERFWLGLQTDYDLEEARRALGKRLDRVERIAV